MTRKHVIGRQCWCEPALKEYPTGMLVTHEDAKWNGTWSVYVVNEDRVVVPTAEFEAEIWCSVCSHEWLVALNELPAENDLLKCPQCGHVHCWGEIFGTLEDDDDESEG